GLGALQTLHPCIADMRGLGAMVAIELGRDGNLLLPDADRTRRVIAEAARRGLILLSCGADANVIRLMVPLSASDAQLDEGLAILGASLEATA
ncbi:MAG: aminotransferase class III-fold pyridoxal phosphate-dependent enzyme, partial [Leptothrix ochracea]